MKVLYTFEFKKVFHMQSRNPIQSYKSFFYSKFIEQESIPNFQPYENFVHEKNSIKKKF